MTIHTKSESSGSFSKEHRAHKKRTAREKEQGAVHEQLVCCDVTGGLGS